MTAPLRASPPRISPEAALLPGHRDPLALLVVWYVRKSSYWMLWLGIIAAMVAGQSGAIDLGFHSPESVLSRLVSPLAGVILAVILRVTAGLAGLALAYPLARAREAHLAPRRYRGRTIGTAFDRLHTARAYRSLRWTHHVRQVAIRRLGTTGRRLSRLDPAMDAANVGLLVLVPVVAALLSRPLDLTV